MASIKGPIQFTGRLGDIRSYYDKDLKKQILSTKGGINKNIIKNNPKLWRTKAMNKEWIACGIWARIIRNGTGDLSDLKNGRNNGKLIGIAKRIQKMSQNDGYGTRKIESSKFNYLLKGFSMNNAHPFKEVFFENPTLSITDDRRTVTLELKHFTPSGKFSWPEHISHFRIYLSICEVPDIVWSERYRCYLPIYSEGYLSAVTTVSDWMNMSSENIDFQLTASFEDGHQPKEKTLIIAAMGVEFASVIQHYTALIVKGHGSMAILECF